MSEVINIKELNERIERESVFVDTLRAEMSKVIVGQTHLIDTLLIALLTYQLAVRDAIARLRERWEVVYEVMRTVHDGYRRVSGFLHRLLW